MDIHFTNRMTPDNVEMVGTTLSSPRLWIPTAEDYGAEGHLAWLEKSMAELREGRRFAMLATLGRRPVAAVVYRPGAKPGLYDIRNISIHPDVEGELYGSFMLRQVEKAICNDAYLMQRITILVDTKITNTSMLGFLRSQGYKPEAKPVDLYESGKPDIILSKHLKIPNIRRHE